MEYLLSTYKITNSYYRHSANVSKKIDENTKIPDGVECTSQELESSLSSSLLYIQILETCLAGNRCSINIFN